MRARWLIFAVIALLPLLWIMALRITGSTAPGSVLVGVALAACLVVLAIASP